MWVDMCQKAIYTQRQNKYTNIYIVQRPFIQRDYREPIQGHHTLIRISEFPHVILLVHSFFFVESNSLLANG